MCVRFWKIPSHVAGHLRADLHGHGNRRNNTFVRTSGSAMRPGDGLHREGLADRLSDARSVFLSHFSVN